MKYKINCENNKYVVYEIYTEQVIKTFESYNQSKKYYNLLENGGGFDGHTPSFILNKINFSINSDN